MPRIPFSLWSHTRTPGSRNCSTRGQVMIGVKQHKHNTCLRDEGVHTDPEINVEPILDLLRSTSCYPVSLLLRRLLLRSEGLRVLCLTIRRQSHDLNLLWRSCFHNAVNVYARYVYCVRRNGANGYDVLCLEKTSMSLSPQARGKRTSTMVSFAFRAIVAEKLFAVYLHRRCTSL